MMGFWDAVASAGSYANNLHLAPDRWFTTPTPQHSIFNRPVALPDNNQQCQNTEVSK